LLRRAWTSILPASAAAGVTAPSHHTQYFLLLRWVLQTFLPGLNLNHDSPDLSLPNGWDYRHRRGIQLFFFLTFFLSFFFFFGTMGEVYVSAYLHLDSRF
jgi:hypothetical protein